MEADLRGVEEAAHLVRVARELVEVVADAAHDRQQAVEAAGDIGRDQRLRAEMGEGAALQVRRGQVVVEDGGDAQSDVFTRRERDADPADSA